jgi:hypothetical protein
VGSRSGSPRTPSWPSCATRYEAAAIEAAPDLDRLWSKIEAGMDPVPVPAETRGFFTRLADGISAWFEQYRGHVAVGAACGAAGVVLALALVRTPEQQQVVYLGPAIDEVAIMGAGVVGGSTSLLADASAAEIESLEVEDGSGTILRMPTDDGAPPTTIIWITRDEESPI